MTVRRIAAEVGRILGPRHELAAGLRTIAEAYEAIGEAVARPVQACFIVSPPYLARLEQLLREEAIVGWPDGVEVVATFAARTPADGVVVLIRGPRGPKLPEDGVLVDLIVYRGGDSGVYFQAFELRLGKYA